MFKSGLLFEVSVALRFMRAKRKHGGMSLVGFLSVAGVSVGVMALIIVIAVMTGAEKDLRNRILGMEPHLILNGTNGPFSDYFEICQKVKKEENVVDALPYLSGGVMLRSRWGVKGVYIRGVDISSQRSVIKDYSADEAKKILGGEDGPENLVILGKGVAESLGVIKGDSIFVMTPNWNLSPIGLTPSLNELVVAGTFKSGFTEYDSAIAYMKISGLQKILKTGDQVTGIGLYLDDIFDAARTKARINSIVGTRFSSRTWLEVNSQLFSALKLEKLAMFIILTLIVLVASFNIASTLIMLVMDKTKEIAVIKTLGATKRRIKRIFVIQGTLIGAIGTLIGSVLGITACIILSKYQIKLPESYPFTTLPVELELFDIAAISISALIISFLATLYPSSQASNLDPVEGIRYGE